MNDVIKTSLLNWLCSFISENKNRKFEELIQYRTKYITVVLEDIYQPHNASAVLRSCDCFGIQNVHIIENKNKYTLNPDVELGSAKWLNLHYYNGKEDNTPDCILSLKKAGYRIIATTPHTDSYSLEELPTEHPFALV